MYGAFQRGGIFLRVATQAECLRSRGGQLDAGHIFVDSNFVAAQAAGRNRRMDGLAFRLILVALETLRRIYILVEWHRMFFGPRRHQLDQKKKCQQLKEAREGTTEV